MPEKTPYAYGTPNAMQLIEITNFRAVFEKLALLMGACGEASREKGLALNHLEDAAMWMNKHIITNVNLELTAPGEATS